MFKSLLRLSILLSLLLRVSSPLLDSLLCELDLFQDLLSYFAVVLDLLLYSLVSIARNQLVGLGVTDPVEDGPLLLALDRSLQLDALLPEVLQVANGLQVLQLVLDLELLDGVADGTAAPFADEVDLHGLERTNLVEIELLHVLVLLVHVERSGVGRRHLLGLAVALPRLASRVLGLAWRELRATDRCVLKYDPSVLRRPRRGVVFASLLHRVVQ